MACASLALSSSALATTVDYSVVNLTANTWQYDYRVTNDSLSSAIQELTIYFSLSDFSHLSAAGAPSSWNALVAQPDPAIPATGFYDALDMGAGIAPGQTLSGFAVDFTWLGTGTPGPQPFDIVDPSTFAALDSGTTVATAPVPLPSSFWLLLTGVAWVVLYWRRSIAHLPYWPGVA